jgi:RNA binding exosome subunit
MDRQELLNFLKENLSIVVDQSFGYYGERSIVVQLKVDDTVVSSDSLTLPKECSCCSSSY